MLYSKHSLFLISSFFCIEAWQPTVSMHSQTISVDAKTTVFEGKIDRFFKEDAFI
jgi:hypothetical protein